MNIRTYGSNLESIFQDKLLQLYQQLLQLLLLNLIPFKDFQEEFHL